MLPEVKINDHVITIKNVGEFNIKWSKVFDNIRKKTGYRLHEIASYSGITYSRAMHSSCNSGCRFSNCEKIALLDLYQDNCKDMNHVGVFASSFHQAPILTEL